MHQEGASVAMRLWPRPRTIIDIKDVRRLRLNPGDVLVVRIDVTEAAAVEIAEQLDDYFPDNRVMVLSPGADVEVLGPPPPPRDPCEAHS